MVKGEDADARETAVEVGREGAREREKEIKEKSGQNQSEKGSRVNLFFVNTIQKGRKAGTALYTQQDTAWKKQENTVKEI